eukprot:gene13540-13666_t
MVALLKQQKQQRPQLSPELRSKLSLPLGKALRDSAAQDHSRVSSDQDAGGGFSLNPFKPKEEFATPRLPGQAATSAAATVACKPDNHPCNITSSVAVRRSRLQASTSGPPCGLVAQSLELQGVSSSLQGFNLLQAAITAGDNGGFGRLSPVISEHSSLSDVEHVDVDAAASPVGDSPVGDMNPSSSACSFELTADDETASTSSFAAAEAEAADADALEVDAILADIRVSSDADMGLTAALISARP